MSIRMTSNGATLSADLKGVGPIVTKRLAVIVQDAGFDVRDEWRKNATETAGKHGWRYPASIRAYREGPLSTRIEPRDWMRQGGMSFEFGSRNQPPHLDGQRALDFLRARIERRIGAAVAF